MAQKTFEFSKKSLNDYKRFHREFAKMHKFARLATVNNLAFKTRETILNELDKSFTIRSPGFVRGSVKFKKARLAEPVSEVGSIERERFSGWIEQETGKQSERKRIQTQVARMGNWKRRVVPRFRMKPGAKFVRPKDMKLNKNQIVPFLQMLSRKKFRQPFFIPTAYKKLQRGLYIFRGRFPKAKIRRLQDFDPESVQPKREPWMSNVVGQITQFVVNKEYAQALKFSIQKSPRLRQFKRRTF